MSDNSHLQIRLSSKHKKMLEEVCHTEKVGVSEKVRELIEGYVSSKNDRFYESGNGSS